MVVYEQSHTGHLVQINDTVIQTRVFDASKKRRLTYLGHSGLRSRRQSEELCRPGWPCQWCGIHRIPMAPKAMVFMRRRKSERDRQAEK